MVARSCLSIEEVAGYVGGSLPVATVDEVVAHIESCEPCRRSVSGAVRASRTVTPDASTDEAVSIGGRIGRYVVLAARGSGAMSHVFEARDPDLDRVVAIKIVRNRDPADDARALREGRALARLAHPNVVTVHDVGEWGGGVFLAMELVRGASLREWASRPRSWREVVRVFACAARGLAAAHRAGLVHCDFKPDNVVVDDDGRCRVIDFGLAVNHDERPIGGTPAYMARNETVGPPTDQYAFMVSLYELLERRRPLLERLEFRRRLPAWLRAIVRRGLAAQDDRFRDMDAVASALERGLAARRRLASIATVSALVLVGALVIGDRVGGSTPPNPCVGRDDRVAGVWNDEIKTRVRSAFLGTRQPYAEATWRGTEAALDDRVAAWVTGYRQACEATHVHHDQSEQLLDRRMMCLTSRLEETRALVQIFTAVDDEVLARAVEATYRLPAIADCADLRSLASPTEAPASLRPRVDAILTQLAAVRAAIGAGRFQPARDLVEPALRAARDLAYRPLEAEALDLLATVQDDLGDPAASEATLRDVVRAAEAGQYDHQKAKAWIRLVDIVGYQLHRIDDALELAKHARAVLEHVPDDELEGILGNSLGMVLGAKGDHEAALAALRAARARIERVHGGKHPFVADVIDNIGNEELALGHYDQALEAYQAGLALRQAALGPDHPVVAGSLDNVGNALMALGQLDDALAAKRRGLELRLRTLGPDHRETGTSRNNLGVLYETLGRYDEAVGEHEQALRIARATFDREAVARSLLNLGNQFLRRGDHATAEARYREALAIREELQGKHHVDLVVVLSNLGVIMYKTGRLTEARRLHERALEIHEHALGPDHPGRSLMLINLGDVARAQGRPAESLTLHTRALALDEHALGPTHPDLSYSLTGIGLAELLLDHPDRAVAALERALAVRGEIGDRSEVGELRFGLARALVASGGDRTRARALAEQAVADLSRDVDRPTARAIEAWLRQHAGSSPTRPPSRRP